MVSRSSAPDGATRSGWILWAGPLIYVTLVGVFFVLRTGGLWTEPDSAVFSRIIRAFLDGRHLVPENDIHYPNGYTYQSVSAFVVAMTGLDVTTLQQLVYPLLVGVIVLPAWAFYREVLGSDRGAALATFLLLSQPEFLFAVLRSSHEKFSRGLVLLCLFLLIRSLRHHDNPPVYARFVVLLYVVIFALIASNNLLTHSFLVSITLALVAGKLFQSWGRVRVEGVGLALSRFRFVLLVSFAVLYLFTFFLYPPAQHQFLVAQNTWDNVSSLFLGTEDRTATNAYETVNAAWTSLTAYFLVSMANWIVLLASFGIWVRLAYRWIIRGQAPETREAWLLWLLYAAFAFQVGVAIIIDMSGALSSNMQQRLFPSVSIFAVALVVGALQRWRMGRLTGLVRGAVAVMMLAFAVLSVMKATNEPLVSNNWVFYEQHELSAVDWINAHQENVSVWTDYDARLVLMRDMNGRDDISRNLYFYGGSAQEDTRDFVLSDVVRARSERLNRPLPLPPDALRVYDNGRAEVYHLRPETPFQR